MDVEARRGRAAFGAAGADSNGGPDSDASEAVLNAVDASLAVETLDVGLRASGATEALLFRMVEARERTECTDATDDRGVDDDCDCSSTVTIGGGGGLREATDERTLLRVDVLSAADRKEGAMEEAEEDVGVSFESGRGSTACILRRAVVVTPLRDTAECVLRATERTEAASETSLADPFGGLAERATLPARVECMLRESLSSVLFVTRSPVLDGGTDDFDGFDPGTRSSSTGTSISSLNSSKQQATRVNKHAYHD